MAERIYINDNWGFTAEYTDELIQRDYEDKLERIRIPHTVAVTPFHYFDEHIYQMISGYRRELRIPQEWKGKKLLLTFEGVAHECELYVNGSLVNEHHCGYTAFTTDISELVECGELNIITVKVNSKEDVNVPPFGYVIDYMTYGGIYRDVYIDVANQENIEDIFVRSIIPSVYDNKAELITKLELGCYSKALTIRQSLRKITDSEYIVLGSTKTTGCEMTVEYEANNIELWDIDNPVLYEIRTELIKDGVVVDERVVRTGFRKAEFRTDGFYLNNKKVRIRGLNRHQSYPYVGYAMPESMQRLDADILKKELGVNAVRTSHYPQSHYFLDRCDELGLLVFTEIPGWQHIGDAAWKNQAVENVRDMVRQYRNHISIILWGVRINESQDDDEFYRRTNEAAHELDPSRQTGGVRAGKKSHLLEDVYTYNDFVHDGSKKGCEPKRRVTSDSSKAYLVSEYNGHMYPTKTFDWEEHRREHAIRHANVLEAVAAQEDIAGSFGWCMFDYNTHKDFGSGDRICYHGVMDMFRNPKLAAAVYSSQQEKEPVLEISSSMDIGEHPACNRGATYIITNADAVRMYKNDRFIKEYTQKDSDYTHLAYGPILINDFIGNALEEKMLPRGQTKGIKKALNAAAMYGLGHLPMSVYLTGLWLILRYHMNAGDAVRLYNRYIGDWGGTSTTYRFEAVKNGRVVKSVTRCPMTKAHLEAEADHTGLTENTTYDVAAIRLQMKDENGNILCICNDPVSFVTEGPIELIGPDCIALQGGMGGTYIRTTGESGNGALTIKAGSCEPVTIHFSIS